MEKKQCLLLLLMLLHFEGTGEESQGASSILIDIFIRLPIAEKEVTVKVLFSFSDQVTFRAPYKG